jgi:hypothetical protein
MTNRSGRYLWGALLSLHVAFVGMSMAFLASTAILAPFSRLECRINVFLHIRQTDYIRGYFSIWIPSVVVALLIWASLRALDRNEFVEEFLRSLAGIMTISAPLAFWVFYYAQTFWPVGWPYRGAPFEITAALVCALLYVSGRWEIPSWAGFSLVAAHFAFWLFAGSSNPSAADYSGPAGPILGFCATVAWGAYVRRLRGR